MAVVWSPAGNAWPSAPTAPLPAASTAAATVSSHQARARVGRWRRSPVTAATIAPTWITGHSGAPTGTGSTTLAADRTSPPSANHNHPRVMAPIGPCGRAGCRCRRGAP